MPLFAPRQRLFALVVLVSLILHSLSFVFIARYQYNQVAAQTAERILEQLTQDIRAPLQASDWISVATLANRYATDPNLTRLNITDGQDQSKILLGAAPLEHHLSMTESLYDESELLGNIEISMAQTRFANIISDYWSYLLVIAVLHLLLWLLYGYLAKPDREQIEYIAMLTAQSQSRLAAAPASPATHEPEYQEDDELSHIQTSTNQPLTDSIADTTQLSLRDRLQSCLRQSYPTDMAQTASHSLLVSFVLCDELDLFNKVSVDLSQPYLTFVDELLKRTVSTLIEQTQLQGKINVQSIKRFDSQAGAVLLTGEADYLPLAAIMLARLYLRLHKSMYDTHVELKRFALPVKAGISTPERLDEMASLLVKCTQSDEIIVLLERPELEKLQDVIQLIRLDNPTTVAERQATKYEGATKVITDQLDQLHSAILSQ